MKAVSVVWLDWNKLMGLREIQISFPPKSSRSDRPPDGGGASKPIEAPKGESQRQSKPPFRKSLAKFPFQINE
jgi:hypothetical protein